MKSERHSAEFRISFAELRSVQPAFGYDYLYLVDTDIPALTLTKQTEGLHAIVLPALKCTVSSAVSPKTSHHGS